MELHELSKLLSEHLCSFNQPVVEEMLVAEPGVCACCDNKASHLVHGSSYGEPRHLCRHCATFFYSNPDVMGYSKPPVKNNQGLTNTFTVMIKTALAIPLSPGVKPILLPPEGKVNKLPKRLGEYLDVQIIKGDWAKLHYVVENMEPPFIYIGDIGRNSQRFLDNLKITEDVSQVKVCSPSSPLTKIVDTVAGKKLAELLVKENPSRRTAFFSVVKGLAHGDISPAKASEIVKQDEVLLACYRLLPGDPHIRLNTLPYISGLIKVL